jgi:HNH endonuclease
MLTLRERFLSYICPEPFSGCWLWMGAADNGGYGVLNINGTLERAHRLAYSLFVGPIGNYLFCCHKCDTPLCANPDHLFLGTAHENSLDMARKGRHLGEISCHKLTNQQVAQIRTDYASGGCTYKSLGNQYGVDHTAIYKIIHRKRWRHI